MFDYYQPPSDTTELVIYTDRDQPANLLAAYRHSRLRLEGTLGTISKQQLCDWCRHMNPVGVATTSEDLLDVLCDAVGKDGWSTNLHYFITRELYREFSSHDVFELKSSDRAEYEAFLARPADAPFLTINQSDDTLSRDLSFMCAGLPVKCYAARCDGEIVGIVTAFPISAEHMDMSRMYVLPQYRGQGIGRSLVSKATGDLLQLGFQPVFAAQNGVVMGRLLGSIGYKLACHFWHRRYWACQKPIGQSHRKH